ncbi:hypothetical protein [Moritella viscosa]|uniref:Uncharacterized lipoprotein RBE_0877 n=1 Tax=Moritella viscosa TaxID=80854 RepID=A0ABY1HCP2_9GAMM|nr:hypothetical protein [Moritella viscosa]SGY86849.1 Uncharacterized lipoprotein RBE_0877 [Moritella viscosa]SGY88363.1 Uncharacterized lipoprotein RBE_0877 [Moritella viscosa]SGY88483.1 Uncharacterized lipoprotein RBE_0877 [Moritella viscosa]SGY90957.1 Uncharacterized lipoprotein RBE_0877 [Moritella viscosa]SHO02089.1 Uncharacterized lipoprotein RBE_0877 [Moritella viscosa]
MAKLDQKFKKKSAQHFDDDDIMLSDRKAHKRTRRDNRQKEDLYALMDNTYVYESSSYENSMQF